MKQKTTHKEQFDALRRIEGQVKGIQRMVESEKYCIDILIQMYAAINALSRVSEDIFVKHIEGCVQSAFTHGSKGEKSKKIQEIIAVLKLKRKLR